MDWNKRFKSFGMGAVSIIGTALVGALVSTDFQVLISTLGVPATLGAAVALAIAEGWKAWVNNRILYDASSKGLAMGAVDLY